MKQPNRQVGYSVADIATAVDSLTCWHVDCDESDILKEAKAENYTYFPVLEDGLIVGVLSVESLAAGRREYENLSSRWLIAADTPILHLIELFAKEPDRHFFVLSSSRIIGMVTPADLNQIPARASVYLLFAHYEALLTELIRREFGESAEELLDYLPKNSSKKAEKIRSEERGEDIELPLIHYVNLYALVEIIKKRPELQHRLKFKSKRATDAMKFTTLRNAVAHQNKLLIRSKNDIEKIDGDCNKIIEYSERILLILNSNAE